MESQDAQATLKSQPPGYVFKTNGYGIFQVIHISRGELFFRAFDDRNRSRDNLLKTGDFLVLRAGGRFTLSSPSHGYQGVSFLAYPPLENGMMGESFALVGSRWLVNVAELLEMTLNRPRVHHQESAHRLGRIMADEALSAVAGNRIDSSGLDDRYWCGLVKKIVRNTLYRPREDYLREMENLNLSYRQLSRIFKRETGHTIKEYQIKERIGEAKRLLSQTGFSVTDIAFELHYPSSQKFAAQFKKETGATPTEFKGRIGR